MYFLKIVLYIAGVFGLCSALPIPPSATSIGDNRLIFGFLAIVGIGAFLGACVCCRRRKRGFEHNQKIDRKEFENESGVTTTAEQSRTQFPIFRALSSPQNTNDRIPPNDPAAIANILAGSHQNIHNIEELDNNNGPISPADMENIENNNAVDFIPNRNEVQVAEPLFTINRNVQNVATAPLSPTASSSAADPFVALDLEPDNTYVQVPSYQQAAASTNNCSGFVNPFLEDDLFNATSDSFEIPIEQVLSNLDATINPFIVDNRENYEEIEQIHRDNISDIPSTIERKTHSPIGEPEAISSMQSSQSDDKSGMDVNSVEEALRALDFAISGEESCQTQKNDDDMCDEDNCAAVDAIPSKIEFDSFVPNAENVQIEKDANLQIAQYECVRQEASILVDSIIEECHETVNAKMLSSINDVDKKLLEIDSNDAKQCAYLLDDCIENENIDLSKSQKNISDDENKIVFLHAESILNQTVINLENTSPTLIDEGKDIVEIKSKSPECDNQPIEPNILECDFFKDLNITASTPFVAHKTVPLVVVGENDSRGLFKVKNLNSRFDEEISPIIEKKLADKTFELSPQTNATFEISPQSDANATYDYIKENRSELCEQNITYTPPTGDKESNSTFTTTNNETIEIFPSSAQCPTIRIDKEEEVTSEDLTTVTPVNTPIELNYSHDTWDQFITESMVQQQHKSINLQHDNQQPCTSKQAKAFETFSDLSNLDDPETISGGGWFLHTQPQQPNGTYTNDTFDVDDDDEEESEANLNLTFDALRKQLAEALPHAQGISGPTEFSDDEDDENEDKSDQRSSDVVEPQAEMIINYKRPLSPIMEECEDDLSIISKTFISNETVILDAINKTHLGDMKNIDNSESKNSTSTECVETTPETTGAAMMGLAKSLSASNDTLFNFEDTLGDDMFSPRAQSQNDFTSTNSTAVTTPVSTSDLLFCQNDSNSDTLELNELQANVRQFKSMEFDSNSADLNQISDLLSPDQQKTFSEHLSSDQSATIDATFTTTPTTMEEKTCISMPNWPVQENATTKEDERISEISEPDWGSSQLYDNMNSLADVPSLNYNLENEQVLSEKMDESKAEEESEDDADKLNDDTLNEENDLFNESPSKDESTESPPKNDDGSAEAAAPPNTTTSSTTLKDKTENFLTNEINFTSSQFYGGNYNASSHKKLDFEKENHDPNESSYHKNECRGEAVIKNDFLCEPAAVVLQQFRCAYATDLMNKHHQQQMIVNNFTIGEIDAQSIEQNCWTVSGAPDNLLHVHELSGEEDPWARLINDIRFTGPSSEIMSTSFSNNDECTVAEEDQHKNASEWDSDVDDSNSSEEFMYVKGTPQPVPSPELYKLKMNVEQTNRNSDRTSAGELSIGSITEEDVESVWNSHEDKVPVSSPKDESTAINQPASIDEENSEDSCSDDGEGEWVPSCWDSMAQPSRSALKSPDKSSSSTAKKRRSVAFKKQNYHSVYEYPKEMCTLSPAYSEPQLWERYSNLIDTSSDAAADLNDLVDATGFNVSSTARPFHGSQFNAQCNTWPSNADFSWSQLQDNDERHDKYPTYSDLHIKWPKELGDFCCSEEVQDCVDGVDFTRADNCDETAENEPLGMLCHTKSSLRLPLNIKLLKNSLEHGKEDGVNGTNNVDLLSIEDEKPVAAASQSSDDNEILTESGIEDADSSSCLILSEIDHLILPTPSCTGSMDSLSSSSGSDRQVSFTTFGKRASPNSNLLIGNNRLNENDIIITTTTIKKQLPSLVLIENENILDVSSFHSENSELNEDDIINEDDDKTTSNLTLQNNKQNDSTDEDSGIESIMRIAKESRM